MDLTQREELLITISQHIMIYLNYAMLLKLLRVIEEQNVVSFSELKVF